MVIIWRDTNLREHRIDLTNAVDVKIGDIGITLEGVNSLRVHTDGPIRVLPVASNAITIRTGFKPSKPSKNGL
jgi:hypothetical protein